ncbi:unnamed protein product, partial [Polarella glacialis]
SRIYTLAVPCGGADVRLVATVLDLYPGHRKVAGAALRVFASMGRLSKDHLRIMVGEELRGMVQVSALASWVFDILASQVLLQLLLKEDMFWKCDA